MSDVTIYHNPACGTSRNALAMLRHAGLALLASGKDRAENVMIVDLLRNDLGRVCEFGSVRVPPSVIRTVEASGSSRQVQAAAFSTTGTASSAPWMRRSPRGCDFPASSG